MENQETRRLGRYEIVAELGRGAMGVVYKARDPQIDRLVALKTVSLAGLEPEQEQEFRKRFRVEAQAAGRLNHPGIVTVFDVGESPEDHNPYIVLEFVAGETLSNILSRQKKLPLATALRLAEELADALDYAHTQGVVHRDIKPANILIAEDGHAKITDFGIAKLNLSQSTVPGKVLGTPAYMSPEQLSGEAVDGRADLFSLGVILYEMATGQSPFHGDSATTVCFKVMNRDPLPASAFNLDLPHSLDDVIRRAIAKDPAVRYQRGAELATDLRELRLQYKPGSTTGSLGPLARATTGSFKVSPSTGAYPAIARRPVTRFFGAAGAALLKAPVRDVVLGAALTLVLIGAGLAVRQALLRQKSTSPQARDSQDQNYAQAAVGARRDSQPSGSPVHYVTPKKLPAPTRAPRKAGHPAGNTHASKAVIVPTATLELAVQHQFKEATLSIWVDNRLVLTRSLHGGTQKHLVVFNGVRGVDSESIQVPAGAHAIRLRAQTPDKSIDISKTVSADFIGGDVKNLQVTIDHHNTIMRVNWE